MDCSDIVIGQVKDGLSRVRDFYTISRATPRLDAFYGGDDSLTSAVAYEQDGITTLIFRKPLKGSNNYLLFIIYYYFIKFLNLNLLLINITSYVPQISILYLELLVDRSHNVYY